MCMCGSMWKRVKEVFKINSGKVLFGTGRSKGGPGQDREIRSSVTLVEIDSDPYRDGQQVNINCVQFDVPTNQTTTSYLTWLPVTWWRRIRSEGSLITVEIWSVSFFLNHVQCTVVERFLLTRHRQICKLTQVLFLHTYVGTGIVYT